MSFPYKDNLDEITVEYLDSGNIFCRSFKYCTYEIDNLDNISELVQKLFIDKVKELNKYKHVIEYIKEERLLIKIQSFLIEFEQNYNKKIKHSNETIEDTFNLFSSKTNFKNKIKNKEQFIRTPLDKNDIFLFVPNGFKIEGYEVIETPYLENEIIFGFKSKLDDPGIILCTNKEGLVDKNNIKMCFVDLGFYPERAYCLLNISNILK